MDDYKTAERIFLDASDKAEISKSDHDRAIRAVAMNNARIALVNENIGKILGILNARAGKRIGPKTERAICDEWRAATDLRVWLRKDYSQKIDGIAIFSGVFPHPYDEMDIYLKYQEKDKLFTEDGKLNALTIESYIMSSYSESDYVSDIPGYIADMEQKLAEINDGLKNVREKIDAYNGSARNGMKSIRLNDYHSCPFTMT